MDFTGCTALVSVEGLPEGVETVRFTDCTSLRSVVGLPSTILSATFTNCSSLTSLVGLPASVRDADFEGCTALTNVTRRCLSSLTVGYFHGCRRLHRFPSRSGLFSDESSFESANEVCIIMRSGASAKLIQRVGPDVALLVGCFATAGLNSSPEFNDHMETHEQVVARYRRSI